MKNIFPENQVNYILRMYLPPWNHDHVVSEIIRFCGETGTEHVMLFTDAQHMVWNQLTLEEARAEATNIVRAIEELSRHGIRTGINSSYNQIPSKFDNSRHNPQYKYWTTLANGVCEKRIPCLLDPALKPYLREFYRILGSTGAEYIYIDDDHRYVFNGTANTWGCMCDLHLKSFSEQTGQNWTGESLQEALFSRQQIRKQWSEFLGRTLEELARVIGNAVHSVNPEMKVGVMVPCLHCSTNYDYDLPRMARQFQPDGKLLLRPCIGPYCDRDREQIIPGLFYMETIRHIMRDSAEYTPELELGPYTRHAKSMAVVRLHIAQGIINGMPNPAVSACGYVGDDPYLEPEVAKTLKREKPYFEALREIAPADGTKKGIGLRFHRRAAMETPVNYSNVSDYYLPAFPVHDFLAHCGFPLTYDPSSVTFLAGDSVYCLSDDELEKYLRGNLILDAAAAQAFADRGFLSGIGASTEEISIPYSAEHLDDSEFCSEFAGRYICLKNAPVKDVRKLVNLQPGAKVLTTITDHDRKSVGPAMTVFENAFGGKVAVMSIRIGPAVGDVHFLANYHRRTLMRNVIRWMDPKVLPISVEDPAWFAVQYFDDGKTILAGLTNTSYDVARELTVSFADPDLDWEKGEYLREDGVLRPLAEISEAVSGGKWKIVKELPIFHYFVMRFPKKSLFRAEP